MQTSITLEEKREIKQLTRPHGRTQWFCEKAGISWEALNRLRTRGESEEVIVGKVRAFLQSEEAQALNAA